MISDRDVRAVAAALVARLGMAARDEAAGRCAEMLARHDADGFASWKIVAFAVEEAIARPRLA
ncbi:MAG: hypothetical protein IT548_05115 [Alphaproteobacteria bacterium]|nr:hypothetical protein [Alphaproteobacteria bacterium]